jgi:hypothetical protein
VSNPTDTPGRDPVREIRAHLEQALAAVDRMRETLPPADSAPNHTGRGGSA